MRKKVDDWYGKLIKHYQFHCTKITIKLGKYFLSEIWIMSNLYICFFFFIFRTFFIYYNAISYYLKIIVIIRWKKKTIIIKCNSWDYKNIIFVRAIKVYACDNNQLRVTIADFKFSSSLSYNYNLVKLCSKKSETPTYL